jgi:hypothetical protein
VVRKDDTQANDVAPGDAGMLRAVFLAQRVGGLADDLQEAFGCELPDAVFVPGVATGFG